MIQLLIENESDLYNPYDPSRTRINEGVLGVLFCALGIMLSVYLDEVLLTVISLLGYMDLFDVPAAPAAKAATATAVAAAAPAAEEAQTEIIAEQEVALAEHAEAAPTMIEDGQTPLADQPVWALLNLIMTILTGIFSAVLLIGYFGKKEEDEDDEDYKELKRNGFARLASIIPAAVSVIAFILTENMANPMVLIDRWTVFMAAILLIQAVIAMIARKSEKDSDDEIAGAVNA